jgi:putative endonuclease
MRSHRGADSSIEMGADRRRAFGALGEQAAAAWLRGRGYEIVARNVRTRYGEIDLVARDGATLVFVEVKARSGPRFGHPLESVGARKRARLARLAAAFMHEHGIEPDRIRFDAVAVYLGPGGDPDLIEHVADAFGEAR